MRWCQVVFLTLVLCFTLASPGHVKGIDELLQDLKTGDEATRLQAIVELEHRGDPHVIDPLLRALDDDSRLVRTYALRALRHLLQTLEQGSRWTARWLRDLRNRIEQQLEEPAVKTTRRSV